MSKDHLDADVIARAFRSSSQPPKDEDDFGERVEAATLGPETLDECPVCHGLGMLSPGLSARIREQLRLEEDVGEGTVDHR